MNRSTLGCMPPAHGREWARAIILPVLWVAAGCGGADPAGPGDVLSSDDVEALVQTLDVLHAFDLQLGDGTSPWPCPGGGQAQSNLAYGSRGMALEIQGTVHYSGCAASDAANAFRITGQLSVDALAQMDQFGRVSATSTSVNGALGWASGGRSGNCSIDLTAELDGSGTAVAGTICGTAVSVQPT